MKSFLSWYSIVMISLGTLSVLIDIISGLSENISTDLWTIVLITPILIHLIKNR